MKKHNEEEDEEIIDRINAGGKAQEIAIERLYDKYFSLIFEGKKKFHQLTQDELTQAYNSAILSVRGQIIAGLFHRKSSLWTFLYRIFFNKCIDIIRKNSSNKTDPYEKLPEPNTSETNFLHELYIKEDFQQMMGLLDKLGDPCRKIIIDSEYYGYSSEEIAQEIGYSNAKSVNSKKYTCLQTLRKMLEKGFPRNNNSDQP
ncbi:MAG: sigma-70 family RNA polymerase sigma factor [Bacteroidia bacterium]